VREFRRSGLGACWDRSPADRHIAIGARARHPQPIARTVPHRKRPAYVPRLIAFAALVAGLALVAVFLLSRGGDDPLADARAAAAGYAGAWSAGDDARAGALTSTPAVATAALQASRRGLDSAHVTATVTGVTVKDKTAAGRLHVVWQVPAIGRYAYTAPVSLAPDAQGHWLVRFTPQTVHPRLTATTRLGTARVSPARAPIRDSDGVALVRDRAVVRVGLQRDQVTDVAASATALAAALDIDAGPLEKAVQGAGPKQFVEAQTLRPADYARVKAKLTGIPGLLTVPATAPLAPTRAFARALLGGVGPATAEQVKASKGAVAAGAQIGQWGLEQAFQSQLAGTATSRILIRDVKTGAPVHTLRRLPGAHPRPLRTTLSSHAQEAAERALGSMRAKAAMVVVQPSTGDILAVANRPVDSTFDRALAGSYPPGSTFKVITTAALLRQGLKPTEPVACPQTIVVDGRTFKNFAGEGGGSAPTFADDFANSCNTAFISLAPRLPADALGTVAADYGLGQPLDLALGVARSHVPAGTDAVSRAATMIGQDKIVASPLAMAGVAAAVAAGRWHAPRLVSSDPSKAGPRLPASELKTIRGLMRSVVVKGTGTALASIPGEPAGKTGTAEYGGGDPPPTHAWFIAYRGDLALAVLVERGRSGGSVAAPLAAAFFRAYGS
jgi:cell division protein FtsI/penicillin-binding protein 2